MKKITFLLVGLLVGITAFSQERSTEYLSEDFSSGVPPTGWTIDVLSEQWSQSGTSSAGGEAPEAKLHWVAGVHTSRLISPEIDLTGVSTAVFSFRHFLSDYSGTGYSIGVATRAGGGDWTEVWSVDPSGDMGPEVKDIVLIGGDVGASDFQVCLFLAGDYYNFNDWFVDDVSLIQPDANDATMQSINTASFTEAGDIEIKCTFKNVGITNLTSIDLNYQIDGGTVITENVSGIDLATSEGLDYTFTTTWAGTAGDYPLDVWVSNFNGSGDDDDTSNDLLSMNLSVATQATQNLPLFESFTSSTCGPCAPFNANIFNPFMDDHPNDIAVVKYQMNWPGAGDPYYTEEGGLRRDFYGVNFVPDLYTGGYQTATTGPGVNNAYASETDRPSFFAMESAIDIDGDNVTVTVNITPYISAEMTVQIAVLEKETLNNTGSNGETSFENVMMKMLPNAEGTLVNFQSGTEEVIIETFDMSSTNVEEMDDLIVVAFVQNNPTKQIMQSTSSDVTLGNQDNVFENVSLYPNPSNGYVNIVTNKELQVVVYNVLGEKVFSKTVTNTEVLDLSNLNSGMYFVNLIEGANQTTKKILINN